MYDKVLVLQVVKIIGFLDRYPVKVDQFLWKKHWLFKQNCGFRELEEGEGTDRQTDKQTNTQTHASMVWYVGGVAVWRRSGGVMVVRVVGEGGMTNFSLLSSTQ